MTAQRTPSGGLIDRAKPLHFRFDGKSYSGFHGDTLTSALIANGVRIMGRSFKYHRARGPFGAWFDDPNAIFNIRLGDAELPNCPGATTQLVEGMELRSVNAWPNAKRDIKGGLDLFHRWLGAGFYYKTFMWPSWHLFEPMIRKMAGLGALEMNVVADHVSDQRNETCDVLVVGGGAAGLVAARAATEVGQNVVLVEDHPQLGGGLYRRGLDVEGMSPADWVATQVAAITTAGGRILTGTTAFGTYDHGMIALIEDRGFAKAPTLWRMRTKRVIMATGAMDRPLTFANNDLPGVMSVEATTEYLLRYGVLVGHDIAVASNNSFADAAVAHLEAAGANVSRIDPNAGALKSIGRGTLKAIAQNANRRAIESLAVSGGWTPLVHLWRHAGGKLDWSDAHAAFLPGRAPDGMIAVGAAMGHFDFEAALEGARNAAIGVEGNTAPTTYQITPHWPKPGATGRQWIDFQHDVTLKDVELASRENYVSVEHLKRYTTLGMASDQGKTSNMAGLAAMAALQGKSIPEVGTTTFRPPFVPVPLEIYHGHHRDQTFHPVKRLVLEQTHRDAGSALCEYGGWLRPGWYGPKPRAEAARDEVLMARETAGILDASPLGKIEVMGPDAEAFVNFIYYNTIKTLKPGAIRYGFMLTEGGVIYDDGVIARVGPNRFIISCSSSHVEGVTRMLETWRQDGNDPERIFVHDTTTQWATLTVTGPKARSIVAGLDLPIDLSVDAFAHMTFQVTEWRARPMRVARVSFTGDLSFELSVPTSHAVALWNTLIQIAKPLGAGPIGIEALSILRAEKGFIMVGKDTDGETMPHDLGFHVPRLKKSAAFVGDRGLHTEVANDPARRSLVGLLIEDGIPIPTGAHLVTGDAKPKSIGIVTSSYESPTLNRPIALALLEKGEASMGQTVTVWHLGQLRAATVASACFFDPSGDRLNAQ